MISGEYEGTVNLGGATFGGSEGGMFVGKLRGRDGAHVWSRGISRLDALDHLHTSVVDGSGDVYLSGDFTLRVDLGDGRIVDTSGDGTFVASLDGTTGQPRWAEGTRTGQLIDARNGVVFLIGEELGGMAMQTRDAANGTLRHGREVSILAGDSRRGVIVGDEVWTVVRFNHLSGADGQSSFEGGTGHRLMRIGL